MRNYAKIDDSIGELQWRDCISHTLQGLGGEFANFTHFTISNIQIAQHPKLS